MNGLSDAITVIIPNYNGAALLPPCLDSLLRQRRPPAAVFVVDNGSRDLSRDLALRHPLRPTLIAFPENRGFAAAVNAGIRAAETPAVALLNNDAIADPRWLEAGARGINRFPEADLFASLILRRNARDRVDSAGDTLARDGRPRPLGREDRAAGYTQVREVFSASAGAAFFRRRLFAEAGLFDESFFAYLEDVDLGFRARLLGHRCLFLPEAVVYHQGAATALADRPGTRPEESSRRVRWIARNKIFVLGQNLPGRWLLSWSPGIAAGLCRSAAYHGLRSGQFAPFVAGTLEGLARLPGRCSRRRSLHRRRRVRLADLAELVRRGARPWP
jgi:hypothetical protein